MAKENTGSVDLFQALWNSADILRSTMDSSAYKSYLLGLIFYKYLSDKMLKYVAEVLEQPTESYQSAQIIYEKAMLDKETKDDLTSVLETEVSYIIKPELTYTKFINQIIDGTFQLESLAQGFRNVEQASERFENLFEDIDLYSKKLGSTPQKQNETIAKVMVAIDNLNLLEREGEVLGDAYEYLIGKFASDSGQKAGEFYTPQAVAKLMTQIAIQGKESKRGFTVYDAALGSGSLLLNAKKYSSEPNTIRYFGQENIHSTYNLARMNMIMHGVSAENQHLKYGDTLDADWPTEEPTNFDAVLMNPPYSAHWSATSGFLQDPRFSPYGALAPKTKADFAFLLHGYYHLKPDGGVMAIVLPHGVLFRGAAEGKIRKALLEEGAIDTVIGLPSNIFFNTSIPTVVIILKKDRTTRDVLFIDASRDFEKAKTQNNLTKEHIDKILKAYTDRVDVPKYAHLATFEEIKDSNDFNLNIPRYVDTFEAEEVVPLDQLAKELVSIDTNIEESTNELLSMFNDLVGTTEESAAELKKFIDILSGGKNE